MIFDPYDPSIADDPYPVYAALRRKSPVYHDDRHDFWALSRFADVKRALSDHETFCSSQGLLVLQATDDYEAPQFPPGNMLLMDPPQHTAYRKVVSRKFLPRVVSEMEQQVRDTAGALVDRFAARGTCDLVAEFATALPAMTFARQLGIPDDDWEPFQRWSAQLVSPAPTAEAMASHHHATEAVSELFVELLHEKRAHPADDLLTELATGTVDGAPLGDAEFVGFAIAMLIAGNDTTGNLLANAMWLLAEHPDARARLLEDPALIPGAVEEILRFEPPVHGLARTLTRDVVIDGRRLEAGKKVLLLFASANRDELEFDRPEQFDPRRRFESHLSFGFGIHHCIGLHLGRLEGRVGIETVLRRLGEYDLSGDSVHWRQTIPTRPMVELPVTFDAGRATARRP
jgi:hypothetical protein